MPLNWMLEVFKWRYLVSPITKITLKTAFHSIYLGLAAGLATPGKVGEWPGRTLPFPKEFRPLIGVTGVFNSLIKTLAISVTGILSWLIYVLNSPDNTSLLTEDKFIIPVFACVTLLALVFLFSRRFISVLIKLFGKRTGFNSDDRANWITIEYRLKGFSISLGRILIFSLQFGFLAYFFLGDQFQGNVLFLPPVYFLILTFIPAFSISDPGIRGSVAILLFGNAGLSAPLIAVTGIVLWLINSILPFFIGQMVFGIRTKTEK